MKNIAIFASGNGSNAEAIVRYFANNEDVCVKCVLTNKHSAGVNQRMLSLGIPTYFFNKEEWIETGKILEKLQNENIHFIVLAGFLAKIEHPIISMYSGRMVNIHPSLLPKYGGKGMWGHHIHEAVISAGEKQSGITIHYIDEHIDGGEILFQTSCEVLPDDTPESLANRIHTLEYKYYPKVIEQILKNE